jgi:hypothetical protein
VNEQKIEDLKNALREVMALIAQRNQPLVEDLKALLVQVMEHVANRIKQLRAEEAQAQITPIKQPELQQAMPSSNVNAFSYDEDTGNLLVQFLGKYPNRQGSLYSYSGVPKVIFDLFSKGAIPARTEGKNAWGKWWRGKVPSIGASLYTLLKNSSYPYQRLA